MPSKTIQEILVNLYYRYINLYIHSEYYYPAVRTQTLFACCKDIPGALCFPPITPLGDAQS